MRNAFLNVRAEIRRRLISTYLPKECRFLSPTVFEPIRYTGFRKLSLK